VTSESVSLGFLLLVVVGWLRFGSIDRGLLAGGSWGLAVPFPVPFLLYLALDVGNVGLVGKLVQVLERRCSDSLRDTLGTRIERPVRVGAHGKQALHVRDEVLG
jgi:hypothetical protein